MTWELLQETSGMRIACNKSKIILHPGLGSVSFPSTVLTVPKTERRKKEKKGVTEMWSDFKTKHKQLT